MSALALFLSGLGCTDTEISIFKVIYRYGPKPVSSIAKLANMDRTYCYKVVESLIKNGLIHETTSKGVRQFFCPSQDVLLQSIDRKQQEIQSLTSMVEDVTTELSVRDSAKHAQSPKITLFDGVDGVRTMMEAMKQQIVHQNFLSIGFLSSRVFETDIVTNPQRTELHKDMRSFFDSRGMIVDGLFAEGILLLDSLVPLSHHEQARDTKPGSGSTHLYVIAETFYLIQRHEQTIGIKIVSGSLTEIIRLLMKR